MLQKLARIIGVDPNVRNLKKFDSLVEQINSLEAEIEALSNDALRAKTDAFKQRIAEALLDVEDEKERYAAEQRALEEMLPEAFAVVREASKRTIGLRHYDVQMIGGMTLHSGKIAEMRTGEGKTLVATLPLYLNALTGRGVHLVTVNDYLARRDARWMSPIYHMLGMSVGVLQMAGRTENGKKAFVIDPEKPSPFEDQDQLRLVERPEAYTVDITYGTNSEFGFDYLRDNLTMRLQDRAQRGHYYAIVDEVDNILIDEARTPLIISGPASDDTAWYARMAQVVRALNPEDYEVSEKDRQVSLTEVGEAHVEELLEMTLRDPERPEDITPEQARIMGYLEQSLRAQHLYRKNKDYIVQAGRVIIVDEFTGRLMPGRRWSEGLHQAVEAKEGVKVEPENITYATITLQNYFRMYQKLAGMTGTAETEAEELGKIYKLDVLPIPTNLEYRVTHSSTDLTAVESKDEMGYKYTYYARRDDPDKKPVFFKRKDFPDVVYRTEEAKLRAITTEIIRYAILGRPQLVGTTSVEHSERLSDRLSAELVRRLLQTLLIRQAWIVKLNKQILETAIPELAPLYQPLDKLNVAELRQLARQADLGSINPEDPANLRTVMGILELGEADKERLIKVIQGGVTHQVLNARKHDEESLIILKAGAYGVVTIATNMAGRGVDIKLGGSLTDEIHADVTRVLTRAGIDPFGMTDEEKYLALRQVPAEEYGIYAEAASAFLQHMEEMNKVRELGGLHVIGSERHEARRIDNQLRGRAARQGDPGSSRFYLSLEDDLMRLFGGGQVEALLKRLKIDESVPIESGMVGRMVEQSQERVEGSNFDIRKHTLEYDDVLNTQRKRIFGQREMVFKKADLLEDVMEMLQSDIHDRVPEAFKQEDGHWRLLAYLNEVQPPIELEHVFWPSYAQRLLFNEIQRKLGKNPDPADVRQSLLELAERALQTEREHVEKSVRELLEKMEDGLDALRLERIDALDTFVDGLEDRAESEEGPVRPQALLDELSNLVRTPLKLSPEHLRLLPEGDKRALQAVRDQVEAGIFAISIARLLGTLERRVDGLELRASQFQNLSWPEVSGVVMQEVAAAYDERAERLLGNDGQIAKDIDPILEKLGSAALDERNWNPLLSIMSQGRSMAFDRRTHRQSWQKVTRLSYIYLAGRLLERRDEAEVSQEVLDHLEGAARAMQTVWGRHELGRFAQAEGTVALLPEEMRAQMAETLGEERVTAIANLPLPELGVNDHQAIVDALGRRLQNEAYRELILRVISQLWIDYLTRIEALRISIGMEAYAQRDPLVMYKTKASEQFTELLKDIRTGVVTAMFTFRPSRAAAANLDRESLPVDEASPVEETVEPARRDKKRKRH